MSRWVAALVCAALILTSPGLEAWAAAADLIGTPGSPEKPVVAPINAAVQPLEAPVVPELAVPQAAVIPALTPEAAALPAAAAAAANPLSAQTASAQAGGTAAAQPATAAGETQWASGAARFDAAHAAPASIADPVEAPAWTSPVPADLRLKPADAKGVSEWMAAFHAKTAQAYPRYEFTVRDFYAWARFVRFYTPSLGIKEAVTRGATYVYGDRFEDAAETQAFDATLTHEARSLSVSDAKHGKDPALARELLKLAEPAAPKFADESSPYQVPVSALIPDAKTSDLVMTATTLKRIEAASQSFALRDFALLLGPPATEKSAIPKYLASQHKIPYLAVTMHPGVGVFELVGGYRPRVGRVGTLADARASVSARLAQDEKSGDYAELLESAARVYGAKPMADVLAAIKNDLSETPSQDGARRLTTLGYALEHGAQSLMWQDGYLTYAIKNDIWITFEELNAAPTETQEFLNEFMRSRRLAVTQKLGETEILSPKPGGRFMLWATMNPETDSNREVLAQTLKNRWRLKYFGHLPAIETAEIIEKKYGMPTVWALSLVENFHRELDRQARERVIGGAWRDGYEVNLRQLLRTAKRWRHFVDEESKKGAVPESRQRFLLAREAYSIYGGMMRRAEERAGVYRMLDQALSLSAVGVRSADDLLVKPAAVEDLGDRIRIGDVELPKGNGGPFVPKPSADYLADAVVLARLYEYAKALALGEPLLLMGDSAAGKTSDLEYLFYKLNRNLRYKNLDSDTAIEEVIGGFAPGDRKGTFTFQEGLVPKSMEEGTGAFLDEFNLNPLVEWLNTVIDDGKLYLPHRIVNGRPMLVAAANPPDPRYPGRILLSAATRSRYTERWVDVDKTPARLTELMGHWLKGGAVYGFMLALLPALHGLWSAGAGGSFALGSYRPREHFPWMILSVAGTAYFFIAALAHFGNPIGFFSAIVAVWTGMIMSDKAKRQDHMMPLDDADRAALTELLKAKGWLKTDAAKIADENYAARIQGIQALAKFPGDADGARMLERLAKAETTPSNLIMAVKTLGDNESSEALPALERLKAALPPDYGMHLQRALERVRARQTAKPNDADELARLAQAPSAPTRREDALARAAAAASALEAKGDLASRLRAQALLEKAAELEAASQSADSSAILLRQLEDLLAAPVSGAQGSQAYGRVPEARGLARLVRWGKSDLSRKEIAALKAAGAAVPDDPARFKSDKKQLGSYFDFSGSSGGYDYSYSNNAESVRAGRAKEVAREFPHSDQAALLLEKLVEAERSPDVVKTALTAIGDLNAPQSAAVLRRLAPKLDAEFAPYVADALAKTQAGVTIPQAAAPPSAAVPAAPAGPAPILERAAQAAALADDGTLAGRLKAQALREKAAALESALDSAGLVSRQLEDLLSLREGSGEGSAAAGSSWLSRLKGLLGSKKKASEGVAEPAGPREDDDKPARAPTLDELLRARGVPESEWPAVRAKVDRVQTIIQMVGGSVGRDTSTRWAPGDLWAFFPDENTVTYPFEDLLTHSEEELVGLTDHEGGHRDITALDQRLPLVRKYFDDPVKHFLWNGFEDPRVNNWDIKRMPGAARYLHAAYDRYLPEDLQAKPTVEAPDLSSPHGDGASAFKPEALQYPHVEFVMAANYYWRYGKRPPKFFNKSAEKAFDQALPEMEKIFHNYPQRTDPDAKERQAYSYDTLKRIDDKLLPLYEPLVVESQKKMARQMKGKGKGKGQGKGGAGALPPQQQKKPQNQKPDPKKDKNDKKDGKPGDKKEDAKDAQGGDPKDDEPLDPKLLKEALDKLKEHAQKASEELGGKIQNQPSKKDVRDALKKKGLTPGEDAPKPLTLQDIAQTQREQLVNRQATAFDRAFAPVAHLSGAMVTHLENIFQKNARPRDEGWYRTGKRPDVKQFMRRQGEGGLRDDYMLRRANRTKRKYKVTLLVDASGSMAVHAIEASRTAVLLAESLTRLQIDVEIILFSNVARVVKSFEQPMTPENRDSIAEDFRSLIGSLGNGMTHDADALKTALTRLEGQDADRKFVFVVTDGAGNGPSKLSDALAQAARDRVFVMGVGIGAGMETYVKANYPRHAVVDTIDSLPLKLKQELERYIGEQELNPRGVPAFVPQGGGNAQGSNAISTPGAPTRFFLKSWALSSLYLLGVMLLLTPIFVFAPHGMVVALGAMPGFLVAIPFLILKMRYGGRYPELGPLGMASMCTGMVTGLAFSFLAPLGYFMVPLVGGLWLAAEAGGMLERRFVPLTASAEAALKAALPKAPLTASEKSFARRAFGLLRSRLAAVSDAADAPKRLLPALSVLALRDPSADVRLAALEALAPSAGFDDGALDALRAAARDRDPSIASRAASFLKEAVKAREAIPQLPAAVDLDALKAGAASDPVEARARALAASAPATLAERLRQGALNEALSALDAARAAGSPDDAAVARRRLEDLLAAGTAQGSSAARAPSDPASFKAFVLLTALGYALGILGLLSLAPWPFGIFVGAPLVGGFIWASRRRGRWLFEIAYVSAAATVFQLLLGHDGRLASLAGAVIIAPAALRLFAPRLRERYQPLDTALRDELRAALKANRPSFDGLAAWRPRRLQTVRMLEARSPGTISRLVAPLSLLAQKDPAGDVRDQAAAVLARVADFDDEALAGLRRAAEPGSAARRYYDAAVKLRAEREAAASSVELAELAPPAPDESEAALARARDYLARAGEDLSGRLRRAAVAEALASLESALASGNADDAAVARRRLSDLLEEGGGAEGSGALPAPRGGWRLFFEKRIPLPLVAWGKIMFWSLSITSACLGFCVLVHPAKGIAGPLLVGSLIVLFATPKGPRSHLWARGAIIGLILSLLIGATSGPTASPVMAGMLFVCLNLLAAIGTVEKTIPQMLVNWGAPARMARYYILRAVPKPATPRQRWWTRALAGTAQARNIASAEMLAAPDEAKAMVGAIGELAKFDHEKMTSELIDVLARVGTPEGDSQLQMIALLHSQPAAGWAKAALEKRKQEEEATLAVLSAPPAPTAEEKILSAAKAELAAPAETLSARLRAKALAEAVATAESAAGDERRLALERVSALLREGKAGAEGSSAAAAPANPSLALWGALAACALALGLAFAPALFALHALSPALALGAGAAGTAGVAGSVLRPLDFRDPRVALGPREESAALPEWAPAQRALAALVARLGLPADRVPALGLWSDAPGAGPSVNGWSGGLRVGPESVIAIGERWLAAPPLALEGLLAHELGHLATGEQLWRNVWARLQRAARWSALGALLLAPSLGWAWPAIAGGAWLVSALLGLAFLRRAELRADRFAAALAGPAAAKAFLEFLARSEAPRGRAAEAVDSVLSDHPPLSRRRAALDAGR